MDTHGGCLGGGELAMYVQWEWEWEYRREWNSAPPGSHGACLPTYLPTYLPSRF